MIDDLKRFQKKDLEISGVIQYDECSSLDDDQTEEEIKQTPAEVSQLNDETQTCLVRYLEALITYSQNKKWCQICAE